jgi:3-carboxy-cis,cis-muconate cycloisomerase
VTPADWGLLDPAGLDAFDRTSDDAVLSAMVAVEHAIMLAWATEDGSDDSAHARGPLQVLDAPAINRDAVRSSVAHDGVAVLGVVGELRTQLDTAGVPARRLHAGATSQDILDSALMLVAQSAAGRARSRLVAAGARLAVLADRHRTSLRLGTTLGRPATPTTLGVTVAGWLENVTSALETLDKLRFPVQYAGAVGSGEQADTLAGRPGASHDLRERIAATLGLADPRRSWQTDRTPLLEVAFGAATVCAIAGRIGRELTALSGAGAAEVELAGGGGSSAMAHKRNPVDAIALTTAGLQAPGLLSTITASAVFADERPAGEWHASWGPFRQLVRLAESAASGLDRVTAGLTLHPEASLAALSGAPDGGRSDTHTIAAAGPIVDSALNRFTGIAGKDQP